MTDAGFIAQVQMEELVGLDYVSLLGMQTAGFETSAFDNRYEYTVELKPAGAHEDLAGGASLSYLHVIPYEETEGGVTHINLIAFLPDGRVVSAENIGTQIFLNETESGGYQFVVTSLSGSATFAEGATETEKLVVIVSTPRMSEFGTLHFQFYPRSRIVFVLYSTSENYGVAAGVNEDQIHRYAGSDDFLNLLVRATVKVYRAGDHTKSVAELTNVLYPQFSPPGA